MPKLADGGMTRDSSPLTPETCPRLAMIRLALTLLLSLVPVTAWADDSDFCAERPGQTTPPCITPAGQVMLESGLAAWQRQTDADSHTDSWTFATTQARVGLGGAVEGQIGWQMLGLSRTTDGINRRVATASGVGDLTLGLLYGPSGNSGPVAVQIFATLPVGRMPIGAGDWGGGARLPVALPVGHGWQLGLTPEIDAAVNQSARGRHLAYGSAFGVGHAITSKLSIGVDVSVMRDLDPARSATRAVATGSLAWQATANTQFDFGGGKGLNRDSLAGQVYFGVAHRF